MRLGNEMMAQPCELQSLRHLARASDGITAKVFGMLSDTAIEGIRSGVESITDEAVEAWKPLFGKEAAFA